MLVPYMRILRSEHELEGTVYKYNRMAQVIQYYIGENGTYVDLSNYEQHRPGLFAEGIINWDKIMRVQIVELFDHDDIVKVINKFDIDVCKVFYDGVAVHSLIPWEKINRREAIYYDDFDDISDKMRSTVRHVKTRSRIVKYEERGFNIVYKIDQWLNEL